MLEAQPPRLGYSIPNGRTAGVGLAVCAAVTIVAIAHHPVVRASAPADVLAGIVRSASADRLVHGVLIVCLAAQAFGFAVFALRRGLQHQSVVGGLIAYAFGVAFTVAAAFLDGFLTPAIAARLGPESADFAIAFLRVAALGVQSLTAWGIAATALGILLWSGGLLREHGVVRIAGAAGIVASLVSAAALSVALDHLTPHSLGLIVAAQTLWYALIAALLIRGNL